MDRAGRTRTRQHETRPRSAIGRPARPPTSRPCPSPTGAPPPPGARHRPLRARAPASGGRCDHPGGVVGVATHPGLGVGAGGDDRLAGRPVAGDDLGHERTGVALPLVGGLHHDVAQVEDRAMARTARPADDRAVDDQLVAVPLRGLADVGSGDGPVPISSRRDAAGRGSAGPDRRRASAPGPWPAAPGRAP